MTLSLFTTVSTMILCSYTAKLASVALTLVGVGLGGTKAIAQTTYPFVGNYDTAIDVVPFGQDISQSIEFATSTDAPYGLTQYEGLIYTQTDPATGGLKFDTNPATFDLPDLPMGYIVFEGSTIYLAQTQIGRFKSNGLNRIFMIKFT